MPGPAAGIGPTGASPSPRTPCSTTSRTRGPSGNGTCGTSSRTPSASTRTRSRSEQRRRMSKSAGGPHTTADTNVPMLPAAADEPLQHTHTDVA
eukprot:11276104-Alexandrium_andersonii.AAC.1